MQPRSTRFVCCAILGLLAAFATARAGFCDDARCEIGQQAAPARKALRWGYIDKEGRFAIPPKFLSARPFSEGFAVAMVGDVDHPSMGYIDLQGKFILPPAQKVHAAAFSGGLGRITIGGQTKFFDPSSPAIPKLTWPDESVSSFHEGLALVSSPDGHTSGFIDTTGEVVIPIKYPAASIFSGGLARVQLRENGLWGFIDKTGKMSIPPAYVDTEYFFEGMAAVRTVSSGNKWGFIDSSGKLVIKPEFDGVSNFSEGLAAIWTEDRGGRKRSCIDQAGKLAFTIDCDEVGDFHGGRAYFKRDGHYGFVNKNGKVVVSPQFMAVRDFAEGLCAVSQLWKGEEQWGYINDAGGFVIAPQYVNAESFSTGLAPVFVALGQ